MPSHPLLQYRFNDLPPALFSKVVEPMQMSSAYTLHSVKIQIHKKSELNRFFCFRKVSFFVFVIFTRRDAKCSMPNGYCQWKALVWLLETL